MVCTIYTIKKIILIKNIRYTSYHKQIFILQISKSILSYLAQSVPDSLPVSSYIKTGEREEGLDPHLPNALFKGRLLWEC